jgi:hypothetical protein
MRAPILLAAALAVSMPASVFAQEQGSTGCTALTQASANAISARIAADDQGIKPPELVKSLSCLDNFFNGVGLNVVVNLLDPANLFQSIEGQICNLITNKWQSLLGTAQCGMTLTGFDLGFFSGIGGGNALGSGVSCPKLNFGGGGPPIVNIGAGNNNSGSLYFSGNGLPPSGYTLPPAGGIW